MNLFKHKIRLTEIIREIPDAELTRLAIESKVDYCTKVKWISIQTLISNLKSFSPKF